MNPWGKAGVVENRFEADRVRQALQEANIPFLMKSFLDTAYDGLFIPQKGWGAVMVPEEFLEEAKRLIGDVKRTFEKEWIDETEQCGGDPEVCHPEGSGRGGLLPDDGGSVKPRD
jgi:hypothetical protein